MNENLVDGIGYDIDRLSGSQKKRRSLALVIIIDLATVIFFSICVYVFINFPSVLLIGRYSLNPSKVSYAFPDKDQIASGEIGVENKEKPKEAPPAKQYPDNTLFIPKIGVKAPVTWDSGAGEVTNDLEKSVVHLEGTSKPGELGNTFITGHSSNYWWKKGDFNSIFALLPQLENNDEIVITYKGEFHHYKITAKEEVKKEDVASKLNFTQERLTLMTCVPVGTNLKRLLIYAEPVN